ncbi:MAG TPA: hypothetical protein VIT23_01975 [Terrimicrobiaceae bacterium]
MSQISEPANMKEESILPRRFFLQRSEDLSGVSGLGRVAYGVQFPDGTATIRWNGQPRCTGIYSSMDDLIAIHGHEGRTVVVWIDGNSEA